VAAGVEIIALRNFRMYTTTPTETFRVLKAVLLLLGRALPDIATWKRCMQHVNPTMFKDINRCADGQQASHIACLCHLFSPCDVTEGASISASSVRHCFRLR
jgi:hypothetical protein